MESQVGIVGFFAMIFEYDMNMIIHEYHMYEYDHHLLSWYIIYLLTSANPHFPSGSNSDPAVERQLLTDR